PRGRRPYRVLVAEELAGAEKLGYRPRLERASGGPVRSVAVGGLTDRSETPLGDVTDETIEDPGRVDAGGDGHVHVWPDQPRPRRALVVGAVSLRRAAAMPAEVSGIGRAQRPQAQGRQQVTT